MSARGVAALFAISLALVGVAGCGTRSSDGPAAAGHVFGRVLLCIKPRSSVPPAVVAGDCHAALAGVTIVATHPGGDRMVRSTDPDAVFRLALPQGRYVLSTTLARATDCTKKITVVSGLRLRADIRCSLPADS